jgi:hypothetical protein
MRITIRKKEGSISIDVPYGSEIDVREDGIEIYEKGTLATKLSVKRESKVYEILDKETCQQHALKYKGRGEWAKNHSASYNKARKKGWLADLSAHMPKKNLGMPKEECRQHALKYKTRGEWSKKHHQSYQRARHKGWFDELSQHMPVRASWI